MTVAEHLELPISERIRRYEQEFKFGTPDDDLVVGEMRFGRVHSKIELYEYILYRLKREEYDRMEIERRGA